MTRSRRALWIVVVGAVACGDDSSGGEGAATDASSSGADDGATTMDQPTSNGTMVSDSVDDSTSASGSSGETLGGSDSSSSGGTPTEVFLSGEVADFNPLAPGPIEGAQISIDGIPGIEAVSDARGAFSLGPVDPDQNVVFMIPQTVEYWGAVIPYHVPTTDDDDVQLSQISEAFVDAQIDILDDDLENQPAQIEPGTAVIVLRLIQTTAIGEGNVVVTMDPPPAPNTYYAPTNPGGAPVLNSNEMQFSLLPVVVFYNLPVTAAGDITFTFEHPVRECTTAFTNFFTADHHVTLVDVDCPPA